MSDGFFSSRTVANDRGRIAERIRVILERIGRRGLDLARKDAIFTYEILEFGVIFIVEIRVGGS